MKQYMISFRSVTYAQRGERSLTRGGFSCTVSRTPKWMEQQGCGYGVLLRTENIHAAMEILLREGIAWRKVYVRQGGTYRELGL